MSQVEIDYLGEGRSDDVVARKIIIAASGVPGTTYRRPMSGTGKSNLDRRLAGLNAGVPHGRPCLVLRDLDHDAQCPSELVNRLVPNRHPSLLLRICVRETESWLMADFEAYADYCGISESQIPNEPENCGDPKQLIMIWAESGRAVKLERHLVDNRSRGVPDWASLGEWHADFAEQHWNIARAVATNRSPSLVRTLARVKALITAS
jgi:hypothetical protein